ncbi:MAG: putative glutamate--cysteine ligase, partial [Phormidesmis sp.]
FISAKDWIKQIYADVEPFAKRSGINCFLTPLKQILREGNQAQQWLAQAQTSTPTVVIQQAIDQMHRQESLLAKDICPPAVAYA